MSSASSDSLRPLALGELIDRSAHFCRAHLKPLFLACFAYELVEYTVRKGVTLVIEHATRDLARGGPALQAQAEQDPLGTLAQGGLLFLGLVGMALFAIWSYWLATMAVTRYVLGASLGEPVPLMDGLKRALRRVGSLTGAYVLSLLWAFVVGVVTLLPGGALLGAGAVVSALNPSDGLALGLPLMLLGAVLGGIGAMGGLLWYFLRFALLAPVLAMEDVGAVKAFRRSGQLVSGRVEPGVMGRVKMRAMLLITVVSGILIAVSVVSSLPVWVVQFSYGNPFDPVAAAAHPVPQALLVPAELIQVLAQSVFTPLGLVFSAMFYLDMRMRREGLDLERRLDARVAPARDVLAA